MKKLTAAIFCLLILNITSSFALGRKNVIQTNSTIPTGSTHNMTMEEDEVFLPGYSHPYKWNKDITGDAVSFPEIWGYVLVSRIKDYEKNTPLTDIGLFAAEINCYGQLVSIPSRTLVKDFSGKVHLVAICESRSLTHFVLKKGTPERKQLIHDLIKATKDFDGLQIDYELVPPEDGANFLSFLKELKKGIGDKPLSVCVPARVKTLKGDVYSYKELAKIADKIMIMAYDEHWSTGKPGSIASMTWCENIADYALSILDANRFILGLPFYGRTWEDEIQHRAWAFNGVNRIMHENNVKTIEREDGIPYFTYTSSTNVTGYYEDAHSILERARMYKAKGFSSIAFWRMGQEDTAVWNWIKTEN